MSQNVYQIRNRLVEEQLAIIIEDCFETDELKTLIDQHSVHKNGNFTTDRNDFISHLTKYFFREDETLQGICNLLNEKSENVARRVEFMSCEEIFTFFDDSEFLWHEGEFGNVIWAMLIDTRQDVQQHGYSLLKHPPNYSDPDSTDHNFLQAVRDEVASQQEQIRQLQQIFQDLKSENRKSERENQILKAQVQGFVQRVETLHETLDQVQSENRSLQEENEQLRSYKETVVDRFEKQKTEIENLQNENDHLHVKISSLTDELDQLKRLKGRKSELSIDLRALEEATYETERLFGRVRSEMLSHIGDLEQINGRAKSTLTELRTHISTLDKPTLNRQTDQPRVGVFVDVQNMFYAAKDRFSGRLDYIKLLDLMVGPRKLIVAYAYIVRIPEIDQSNFVTLLERHGYKIRSKDLRLRNDGSAKGDWDVGMAVDIVAMLDMLDVVILASGDGDFCALADLVKQQSKRIEVAAFEHNTSFDLQRVADRFFPIGDHMII